MLDKYSIFPCEENLSKAFLLQHLFFSTKIIHFYPSQSNYQLVYLFWRTVRVCSTAVEILRHDEKIVSNLATAWKELESIFWIFGVSRKRPESKFLNVNKKRSWAPRTWDIVKFCDSHRKIRFIKTLCS